MRMGRDERQKKESKRNVHYGIYAALFLEKSFFISVSLEVMQRVWFDASAGWLGLWMLDGILTERFVFI